MGRVGGAHGRRGALLGLLLLTALVLAACAPFKAPVKPAPLPAAPNAAFDSSAAPLVVAFTDQSTGDITGWWWDFGDGTNSVEQNPTHTYAQHGDYLVTLTVLGPGGADTASSSIAVNPPPPVASFTAAPSSGIAPLTVVFTDTSTGVITDRTWDLDGDGVFGDASGPSASRTFSAGGNHVVALTVTGPGGDATTTRTIPVTLPPPPVASFTAIPSSGAAPLNVSFTDTSTGAITSRSWDFNSDGVADATGPTATHTFSTVGTHQVTLLVTGLGGDSTATQQISAVNTQPVVDITLPADGASFVGGSTVTFTGTANDAQDGALSSAIQWSAVPGGSLGTGASVSSSTLSVGTHTITASVTDGDTATVTDQITITVTQPPPVASFTAVPSGGFAPLTVQLTDTSTGNITSRVWTLGNGDTITSTSPVILGPVTYNAGIYLVTLTVAGPGGSSSASKTIIATAPPGDDCGQGRCEPPPDECIPPSCDPRM